MPGLEGKTLGRYEIVDLLGAGGMGEVYRAKDTQLSRPVAVKVVSERVAQSRKAIGEKLARDLERELIPPFDDERVIAGQGTVALELLEGRLGPGDRVLVDDDGTGITLARSEVARPEAAV